MVRQCCVTGKVTAGLASHWLCVTDFISLRGNGERKHLPTLLSQYYVIYFFAVSGLKAEFHGTSFTVTSP